MCTVHRIKKITMPVTFQVSHGERDRQNRNGRAWIHYRCIGVRYFQKTLISTAVTPTDGYLTVRFITVAVEGAQPLTFSVLLLTKGKLGGFELIPGKALMVLIYFKHLAVAE